MPSLGKSLPWAKRQVIIKVRKSRVSLEQVGRMMMIVSMIELRVAMIILEEVRRNLRILILSKGKLLFAQVRGCYLIKGIVFFLGKMIKILIKKKPICLFLKLLIVYYEFM